MRWPWIRPERRAESLDYAAKIADAFEAAAGCWSRAFAVGMPTPAVLTCIGRELILRGEIVFDIRMSGASLALIPASNWDVEGRGPDPATWRYRVYLNGPSGTTVAMRPAAGVVHAVYSVDPARPWEGVSRSAEPGFRPRSLRAWKPGCPKRPGRPRGGCCPSPTPARTPATRPAHSQRCEPTLRRSRARRRLCLQGRRAGARGAPALREAYRQFVHLSVAPVGKAVAAELALKLDTPGLAFDWSGLMAADVASRARAFQALTGGGMDAGAAAAAAGLEV